jgi:hypothetical protein
MSVGKIIKGCAGLSAGWTINANASGGVLSVCCPTVCESCPVQFPEDFGTSFRYNGSQCGEEPSCPTRPCLEEGLTLQAWRPNYPHACVCDYQWRVCLPTWSYGRRFRIAGTAVLPLLGPPTNAPGEYPRYETFPGQVRISVTSNNLRVTKTRTLLNEPLPSQSCNGTMVSRGITFPINTDPNLYVGVELSMGLAFVTQFRFGDRELVCAAPSALTITRLAVID